MIHPDFKTQLSNFTIRDLNLAGVEWEDYPNQYATQVFPSHREATEILEEIVDALGIRILNGDPIKVVKSRSGNGYRVLISHIPSVKKALEKYNVSLLTEDSVIESSVGEGPEISAEEVESLLNQFCVGEWDSRKEDFSKGLKEIELIKPCHEYRIEALKEGGYLLKSINNYNFNESKLEKDSFSEQKISQGDIELISSVIENYEAKEAEYLLDKFCRGDFGPNHFEYEQDLRKILLGLSTNATHCIKKRKKCYQLEYQSNYVPYGDGQGVTRQILWYDEIKLILPTLKKQEYGFQKALSKVERCLL